MDEIYSIACHTTNLARGWLEDKDEEKNGRLTEWMLWKKRKMDDHLVHTTPNLHPPKMNVLPKSFLQIILAAK